MAAANCHITPALVCEVCTGTLSINNKFCSSCGTELDVEKLVMKYYFNEGYEYEVILCFLLKYHGITMSMRKLKARFKSLGLRRRNLSDSNEQVVRTRIQAELDGPGCRATGACGMLYAARVTRCRGKQWRHTYKKWILKVAKEEKGESSREECTPIQARTTAGILTGMTKSNLMVLRSMAAYFQTTIQNTLNE